VGPPVDVAPAEADVASAEFSLIQAENAAALARARLKQEMGVPPTYNLRTAPPQFTALETPLAPLQTDLDLALQCRSELFSVRNAIAASRQALQVAKALEYGAIALTAQYSRGIAGPDDESSWLVLLSASGFLFDGGARAANTATARADLRTLQAQEQQLANAIGLEVESARLDVETARESVQAAEKAVVSAEAQLAAAQGKYKAGVGIFVEILDAQETVTRARTNLVRARYDLQTALVALRRATGQLQAAPPAEET
jgi:outer membrane protein TolC